MFRNLFFLFIEVRDLGVIIDSRLEFTAHLNKVISKAKMMLGFIVRQARTLYNPETLRVLYCAFVRPHLEYAAPIWFQNSTKFTAPLEKIQKHFLRLFFYKHFQYYPTELTYEELLAGFEIQSIQVRNDNASMLFIHNIIHSNLFSPNLLKNIKITVPKHTSRHHELFKLPKSRTKLVTQLCINRGLVLANGLVNKNSEIDFLNYGFKKKLIKHLRGF